MILTLFRGRIKVLSTIVLHSPLNISETVRDRGLVPQRIKCSRDRWCHLTQKGQIRDSNTLRAQYLENSWRCYLATIANYYLVCCERQYGRLS